MKKICCFILFVFLFVASAFAQEAPQADPAAMQTMLALNYCHMSLVKILAYEDRVVLDEEYHNIINNINLVTIQDRELLTVLKSLMDTLTDFRLAEKDREYLQQEYDRRVSSLMYAQVGDGVLNTGNQVKTLVLARMVVNYTKKVMAADALQKGLKDVTIRSLGGLAVGGPLGAVSSGELHWSVCCLNP